MVCGLGHQIKSCLCQRIPDFKGRSHKPAPGYILMVIDKRCFLIDTSKVSALDIFCHLCVQGIIIPCFFALFSRLDQSILQNVVTHCQETQFTVRLLLFCLFLRFLLLGGFDLLFLFHFFLVVAHSDAHNNDQ